MSRVLVVKQTLLSVDMQDGEFTTVNTLGTSQYRALLLASRMLLTLTTQVFNEFLNSMPIHLATDDMLKV